MTAQLRTKTMCPLATSTTKSERVQGAKTFATLRFAGDALEPERISGLLGIQPTHAYRKGQLFSPGPRSPQRLGRTGVWYLATDHLVTSNDLAEHLRFLANLLHPESENARGRLGRLRDLIGAERLEAHVTCFWHGPSGAREPGIPPEIAALFQWLPADLEKDFATD